jgi:hypothetical protein
VGKHWLIFERNITVGEVDTISLSDVEEAGAWKIGDFAHFSCRVFWDVTDMMSIRSEHFDGIGIVGVGGFGFEGTFELAKVLVKVATIFNTCNMESYDVK